MNKVFSAFYSKKNAQPGTFRVMFDGERLKDDETADSRDMEEGTTIDAQLEQTGGA
jgi:small ubiquitin-related modifier